MTHAELERSAGAVIVAAGLERRHQIGDIAYDK
jgi:hypothetical protein